MPYKHTQIGYVMIISTSLAALVALVFNQIILLLIVGTVGILFSTLTVSVEGEYVRFWFGPGFINMQLSLSDIESCQVAKSRCWSWGIHGWPGKGWVFNVSGFQTVELKMRNDGKYYIGTDEPEALEKAIHEAMRASLHRTLKPD